MGRLLVLLCCSLISVSAFKLRTVDLDERIVNGTRQDITGRRFQVSFIAAGFLCGGSLIAPDVVLTAAHCTRGIHHSEIVVRAGSNVYYKGGQTRDVTSVKYHPEYNGNTMVNDVALLKLEKPLKLSDEIGVIKLAKRLPGQGKQVLVSGFGATSTGGEAADYLLVARLKLIDFATCKKRFGSAVLKKVMTCAGISGRDACQGDSGGPLTYNGELIGVVSWGYDCADPNFPGVYASVPALRKWIVKNAKL